MTFKITFDKTMYDSTFQDAISSYLVKNDVIHSNIAWVSILKDGIIEIDMDDVQDIANLCESIGVKKAIYLSKVC